MGGSVSLIDGHIDEPVEPCLLCKGERIALDEKSYVCTRCGVRTMIVPTYKYIEYKGEWGK